MYQYAFNMLMQYAYFLPLYRHKYTDRVLGSKLCQV